MRFLLSVILLSLPLTLSSAKTDKLRRYGNKEAYKVYAALLPGNWSYGKPAPGTMVILQETTDRRSDGCFPDLRGDWVPVLENYKRDNRASRVLSHSIRTEMPYVFVPSTEIEDMFSSHTSPAEGWNKFYKRYPDSHGLVEFSAVGFNSQKTKALIYVVRQCGGLCGTGGYEFLVKRNGEWVKADIRAHNCGWIS